MTPRQIPLGWAYQDAGVREIIGRTGLAPGTFYNYFPDKAAVFRAIVDESARELRRRLRTARRGPPDSRDSSGTPTACCSRSWPRIGSCSPWSGVTPGRSGRCSAIRSSGRGCTSCSPDLRAAIARGDLPGVDADYLAGAMAGVALELGVRMAAREPPDPAGAARFAAALVLGGVAALGPTGAGPGSPTSGAR